MMCRNLVILVFSLGVSFAGAQTDSPGLPPMKQQFDAEQLEIYRKQKEFQYDNAPESGPGWLERQWDAFRQWLESRIGRKGSIALRMVWYFILLIGLIYTILVFTKLSPAGIFSRPDSALSDPNILGTHPIPQQLDGLVRSAEESGDFRMAFRYAYVRLLNMLDAAHHIKLTRYKTNTDYILEMSASPAAATFRDLAWAFNSAWYGEYSLNESDYRSLMERLIEVSSVLTLQSR